MHLRGGLLRAASIPGRTASVSSTHCQRGLAPWWEYGDGRPGLLPPASTMDNVLTPAVGDPSQVYMLRAADLESVVRKIMSEEAARREAERSSLMITASEVCKRLKIDPSTLWRWCKCGRLKSVRVGRERLFKETDIDLILDGGRRL